ncbi:MAG: transketolase C-terminal domain-containing protein [bacterium]|nr:transketolase C-terminal domain-containing protein [bacterium]
MINSVAKLNPKLFDLDIEQKPTRDGYGEGLVIAGEANPNVVVLTADLKESTRCEAFEKKFPERFIEVGVAEQNMATIAAGLGISGKIPFISSYATFSPGRNWEQIRTTICYNDSNVKIAGHHAGVSVGPDGATHQALEDIALMRALPNMKVIVPCDAVEARKATVAATSIWGPVYLRFSRDHSPVITTEETPFTPGKAVVLWKSKKPQVAIVGCGPLLYGALAAAKELEREKIGTVVVNSHTVKPLDERLMLELAETVGRFVTVEEHQIAGGLGGAIAELLAARHPCPIEFIGMRDSFGQSGKPSELIAFYSMGANDIAGAVRRVMGRGAIN